MKLSSNVAEAERYGQVAERSGAYTVSTNRKTFEILYSKVYKDKIAAIIRELSCNALDSHIEAGCPDRPFDVHLPTELNPFYVIRDYGVGMSEETVESVYKDFGTSTKEHSNDFIGALGLGGKSPFSYVDSFTVTIYMDGECRVYSCYKSSGIPNVDLVSRFPSDEERGVEIRVPVHPEDISHFRARGYFIWHWFETRPNTYNLVINWEPYPEFEKGNWTPHHSGLCALMGSVIYPIDTKIISHERAELDNIVIKFDIGELDVQAGREELSYDPITITNIVRRINEIRQHIDDTYAELFKDCHNIVEALAILGDNGYNINHPYAKHRLPTFNGQTVTRTAVNQYLGAIGELEGFKAYDYNPYSANSSNIENLVILLGSVNDRRNRTRLHHWRRENPRKWGYFLAVEDTNDPTLRAELGNFPVFDTSKIALEVVRAKVRHFHHNPRSSSEVTLDLDEPKYYVRSRNLSWTNPSDPSRSIDGGAMFALINRYLGEYTKDTYFFPASRATPKGWTDLYSVLAEKYAELADSEEFVAELSLAESWGRFQLDETWFDRISEFADLVGARDESPLATAIKTLERCRAAHKKQNAWLSYRTYFNIDTVPSVNCDEIWSSVCSEYPLVAALLHPDPRKHAIGKDIARKELLVYARLKDMYGAPE